MLRGVRFGGAAGRTALFGWLWWSWPERQAGSTPLTAAEHPGREFDAVVVGECERAFHGDQFWSVVRRLNELGVQVWLSGLRNPASQSTPQ
ncbi:hypothetical protein ACTG9Q_27755 [Actinokineospora sp. 24-640]